VVFDRIEPPQRHLAVARSLHSFAARRYELKQGAP
jgi:hypothetical protein